jgi:hypothetical protein
MVSVMAGAWVARAACVTAGALGLHPITLMPTNSTRHVSAIRANNFVEMIIMFIFPYKCIQAEMIIKNAAKENL